MKIQRFFAYLLIMIIAITTLTACPKEDDEKSLVGEKNDDEKSFVGENNENNIEYTVTAEEWDAALSENNFVNVSISYNLINDHGEGSCSILLSDDKSYECRSSKTDTIGFSKTEGYNFQENGTRYGIDIDNNGVATKIIGGSKLDVPTPKVISLRLEVLINKFSEFKYKESDKCYVGTVDAVDRMPYTANTEVYFENNRVVKIKQTMIERPEQTIEYVFYDYGNTVIEIPNIELTETETETETAELTPQETMMQDLCAASYYCRWMENYSQLNDETIKAAIDKFDGYTLAEIKLCDDVMVDKSVNVAVVQWSDDTPGAYENGEKINFYLVLILWTKEGSEDYEVPYHLKTSCSAFEELLDYYNIPENDLSQFKLTPTELNTMPDEQCAFVSQMIRDFFDTTGDFGEFSKVIRVMNDINS